MIVRAISLPQQQLRNYCILQTAPYRQSKNHGIADKLSLNQAIQAAHFDHQQYLLDVEFFMLDCACRLNRADKQKYLI